MSFIPASPKVRREPLSCRAVADDTLGEQVVRRLSWGSNKCRGSSPYKQCL